VELIQRFSDPPYSHCPKCGGEMKKLFSAPAIQFKGSGFYKTDYANTPSKSDAKSDTKSDTTSETKSETKSESESKTNTTPSTGGGKSEG
jgi:putative FmdB family regulatory protein